MVLRSLLSMKLFMRIPAVFMSAYGAWTPCNSKRWPSTAHLRPYPVTVGIRLDPRADKAVTFKLPDMMGLDNPEHQRLRSLVQKE
jgi:cytochrome P450